MFWYMAWEVKHVYVRIEQNVKLLEGKMYDKKNFIKLRQEEYLHLKEITYKIEDNNLLCLKTCRKKRHMKPS